MSNKKTSTPEQREKEGNTCIGLGAGIGALGLGSLILTGATCPLCYFVAPGLVGVGIHSRIKAKRERSEAETTIEKTQPDLPEKV